MNISVKETTVFSVFHSEAQDLYNTCSDLKKVAWVLWDPSIRLKPDVSLSFIVASPLIPRRKNQFGCLRRSPQCFANDQPGPSSRLSRRWVAPSSSSRKNLTERGCRYISAATSTSIRQGRYLKELITIISTEGTDLGRERITPISMVNT